MSISSSISISISISIIIIIISISISISISITLLEVISVSGRSGRTPGYFGEFDQVVALLYLLT